MLTTALTEILGLPHPIVPGPMGGVSGGVSGGGLAAAFAKA